MKKSKEPKTDVDAAVVDRVVIEHVCVHVRWMNRRDMPEVLDIENGSFKLLLWTEEDFIRQVRKSNCIGMVAEHDEQVVGFMIYELHKGMLTIENFGVHPDYQRRSIGRQMINKLVGKLSQQRRSSIELVVSQELLGMQIFLSRCGFFADRPSRYDDCYRFVFQYVSR
jgi:ribosomal-protein-alanine N-acetyltransferase